MFDYDDALLAAELIPELKVRLNFDSQELKQLFLESFLGVSGKAKLLFHRQIETFLGISAVSLISATSLIDYQCCRLIRS